jgi:hypothetical protein
MVNTKNYFLSKDNIILLWEVISDEELFKYLSPDKQRDIYNIFLNNINDYFNKEKNISLSLVELNKKYVILIKKFIEKKYQINYNKIKINKDNINENNELITFEEIQNEKKNNFDNKFNKLKNDFDDIINIKKPQVPNFSEDYKDIPIKEMDKMIKEISTKRNYDVEIINNYNKNNLNNDKIQNWLNLDENQILEIDKEKKISWGENSYLDNISNIDESIIAEKKENILPLINLDTKVGEYEIENQKFNKYILEEIKNINNNIYKILKILENK